MKEQVQSIYEVDLKARLGDLSGLSSALVGSKQHFGLFSENVFLTGKIIATSGEIAGWDIDSNILKSGTNLLDSGNEKQDSDQTFGNIPVSRNIKQEEHTDVKIYRYSQQQDFSNLIKFRN